MNKPLLTAVVMLALVLASCVKRQEKSRNADKYDNWIESLNDSVKALQDEQKRVEDSLTMLYDDVDRMNSDFTYVDNPRQVEGYTMLKAARGSYPLTRTGLAARYTKREEFEIVAASGSPFTSITVSDGSTSVATAPVARDQGLNYTTAGLTTVLFADSTAYEVGRFIAAASRPLTVSYGGRSARLSAADAQWVAATWRLAEARRQIKQMEQRLPLLSKKIEMCRMHLEKKQ